MSKKGKVKILALESSADETGAAVLEGEVRTKKFRLLSNVIYSQVLIHQKTGGIVPEVAARNHIVKILPVIRQALAKARVHLNEIDAIAVTHGPGLITSLMIGVDTAKALAFALSKPLIAVNHHEGHLLSALATLHPSPRSGEGTPVLRRGEGKAELKFPALGLIVSGGHTMLVLVEKIGRYQILGATLDDAAGECFDKIAKILDLPYPGGPQISQLAKKGNSHAFNFPRPMVNAKNYNFSFSGLKTAVLYFYRDVIARSNATKQSRRDRHGPSTGSEPRDDKKVKADVAASVEQAIIDVLISKTIRAAKQFKVKTILLGGGVAANQKLQKTLRNRIKKDLPATSYHLPPSSLTTDNAGMIAIAAYFKYIHGKAGIYNKVNADPNLHLRSWR